MLGLGKKKDKEKGSDSPAPEATGKPEDAAKADKPPKGGKPAKGDKSGKGQPPSPPAAAAAQKAAAQPKKKRFSIKKLILILVILGVLGGGGYAGYLFFFKASGPAARVFKATALPHLTLPQEMIKFSFTHYPDLYDAFLQYEREVSLFEKEIARIDAIAAKYPEQQKITDRQKKIWEKGKNTLLKEFAKLEKPVKQTFVLFQVNPKEGQARIDASAADLAATAKAAIEAAQKLSADIKAMAPQPPDGLIKGTLYKLKKKFL